MALTLIMSISMVSCDQATLARILESGMEAVLSNEDVAKALKQALNKGVKTGASYLSKEDGFLKTKYKIPLPTEAQTVVNKLKIIPGFKNFGDKIIEKINRSAEDPMIQFFALLTKN